MTTQFRKENPMATEKIRPRVVTRRELLGLMGAAGVMAVVGCGDGEKSGSTSTPTKTQSAVSTASPTTKSTGAATATATAAPVSCVVTPALTEGPYFVDEMLNRSDIRSDPVNGSVKDGVPLGLTLTVSRVDGTACTPIAGAVV